MKICRSPVTRAAALRLHPSTDLRATAGGKPARQAAENSRATVSTLRWSAVLLSAAVVLAVNFPVLEFEWLIFDDDINILVNPYLGSRATESVRWAFENVDYMRRYLPLGWLMFAGLLAVDGYSAPLFHAAGWVLTALNTVLIYFVFEDLCRKFAQSRSDAPRTDGSKWIRVSAAAVTAVLWSLHPLRVENAAWISGLLYVASTSLALGAVLLHLRSLGCAAGKSVLPRMAACVLYLGSLLVYPVYLSLPAVLVCGSVAVARGGVIKVIGESLRRTAGWWLAAAFCGGMNAFARVTASEAYVSADTPGAPGAAEIFLKTARAVAHYVAQTLWPVEVAAFYGASDSWIGDRRGWIAIAFILVVSVTLLACRSNRRPITCWLIAALCSIAPFLAHMDHTFHPSDRYTVLWLAVWAAPLAIWTSRGRTTVRSFAILAATLLVLVGLARSYSRALPNWKDTRALQTSIDRKTAVAPSPQFGYARAAIAFWWLGDRATAERKLEEGAQRFPDDPAMAATRNTLRDFEGRWRERVGLRLDIPPLAVHHVDLGRAWLTRGARAAATAHFVRALRLAPEYREAVEGLLQSHALH
jgi:hypothetical protein